MKLILFVIGLLLVQSIFCQDILLKNATIIDGDANTPIRERSILIRDGRIQKIAKKIKRPNRNDVRVIDCKGKYVTPGIFDAHVHLGTINLKDRAKANAITDSILRNMIAHGITTVRDMAGNAPFINNFKKMSESGESIPDIYYAAQFAGPSYFKMLGGGRSGEPVGVYPWERSIGNTTDIEQAIIDAKNAGVTGIKIYADLSADLVSNITEMAYKHGLLVWSHAAVFPIKPSAVAEAGVTSMSHVNDLVFEQMIGDSLDIGKAWDTIYKGLKADTFVMKNLLLLMKRKNIFLDPTLLLSSENNLANAPIIAKQAHNLGVRFVTGTDWVYPTKGEQVPLKYEFLLLQKEAGLSSREVIEAATKNSAEVTGLKDRGVIEKGKRADLLILDSNPVEVLSELFNPKVVIKKGKIVEINSTQK